MLSIENSPPDPSSSCDIPQLKTGSDERASLKLALPDVDLSKPVQFGNNPPSNFSIRDYVLATRSKDIEKNWPFSLTNLQLCLKHGARDLLPPFQPLDKVRNQSFQRCTVESSTLENKNLSNSDGEPSRSNDHAELDSSENARLTQKPTDACLESISCRSQAENDFPSTITSVSQSDIESLPTNKPSSSPLDTDTLPEVSVEVEAAAPVHKTESTSRPSKKCRLVLKFGANSDRSSTEDIASNCTTVSELTMASKTCPVCKTFSSSSNTTLNAHIDQCLSVESAPKWMTDSKLTRHRIKTRKTRLMEDIYTTAARCTLEELDRRNGTSWATISNLPSRENDNSEMPDEGKNPRMSPVHSADTGDVGAVYIDSNGTKVRILSKFNDAPSVSQLEEELVTRKPSRGGKGSKFLTAKKKKRRAHKHHKYLRNASSKKVLSHKAYSFQNYGGQGFHHGVEERCEKRGYHFKKQVKSSHSGSLRHWARSKRTVVAKKVSGKDDHDHQPQIESDQLCSGDSLVERSQVSKLTNESQKPISSPENSETMKNPFCEALVSDKKERSPGRKRMRSPLLGDRSCDTVDRLLPPVKRNVNQLSKEDNSVCDGNCITLSTSKLGDIASGPNQNSYLPPGSGSNPSRSCHSLTSKTMKLRKKLFSVRSGLSVSESGADMIKLSSALKTSQMHPMAEIDGEAVAWLSEADHQYDLMQNHIPNQSGREEISNMVSLGNSTVSKIKQVRGAIRTSERVEAITLKSSQLALLGYGHDKGENMDSAGHVVGFLDKAEGPESARKELVIEPATKRAVAGNVANLCQRIDPELQQELGNCTENRSKSGQSIEDYGGSLCRAGAPTNPTQPNFANGKEIYCTDEVGNGWIGQSAHTGEEMDSENGQANFYADVDPIPIPGPPGSFLPSPGDMGSEDLQGSSSLTTSRVQSSQDHHDFIDGDSSDSPISTTSTVSNSTLAGYDQQYTEPLSSPGPQSVQDKLRSGFSGASVEPSAESSAVVPRTSNFEVEGLTFDGDNCKPNKVSIEKGPLSFRSDEPCCCQRRERISQGGALNHQESQLLKRRAIASVTIPTTRKQMGCNLNTRPGHLDERSETFSLSSCPSLKSERASPPIMKSPAGSVPFKGSPDASLNLPSRVACDSASPSASNPVLRLMGKNLMVVNKDEDGPMLPGQSQQHHQMNPQTPVFTTFSEVSPVNTQNHFYLSYHQKVPQIGQNSHNLVEHCFDGSLSNNFRSHANLKTPQTLSQGLGLMFPEPRKDGAFIAFEEPHEYKGHNSLPAQENKSKSRQIAASMYHVERLLRTESQQISTRSASNANGEIIVIDDILDSEDNLTADVANCVGGMRDSREVSSGGSIPVVPSNNSRHANPFNFYQPQDPPSAELTVVHNASFHANPSRGASASSARWSCTSEGSSVLQRTPFLAASPSRGHLRSALYNSPSLM